MLTDGVGIVDLHFSSMKTGLPPLLLPVKAYWCRSLAFPLLGTQSLHQNLSQGQGLGSTPANVIINHGDQVMQVKYNDQWYFTALRATDAGPVSSTVLGASMRDKGISVSSATPQPERVGLSELHERLGHASNRRCIDTAKVMDDIELVRSPGDYSEICQPCAQAKFKRPSHSGRIAPVDGLVATDTMHMSPHSSAQHKFIQVFVHSSTRYLWAIPLKAKTQQEIFRAVTIVLTDLHQAGHSLVVLQSDGAKELVGIHTPTARLCKQRAIKLDTAVANDHFGNTLAERGIQRFQLVLRVSWLASKLPRNLWHRFSTHVVTTINHTINTTTGRVPAREFWARPSLSGGLHPLGCRVYYFNPPESRVRSAKLTMPSKPGWYLGPADRFGEFFVLEDGSARKVVVTRLPRFIHSVRYGRPSLTTSTTTSPSSTPPGQLHLAGQHASCASDRIGVGESNFSISDDAAHSINPSSPATSNSGLLSPLSSAADEGPLPSPISMEPTSEPAFQVEFKTRLDALVAKEQRKRVGARQGWTHTDLFSQDELVAKALAATKSWWRRNSRRVSATQLSTSGTPALTVHESVLEDTNIALIKGMAHLENLEPGPLPTSLKKIRAHPAAGAILDAMARELGQVLEATLHAIPRDSLPSNAEVIPSMFLNARKRDGSIKARLVALGNLQRQDKAAYYSATADSDTFKLLIAFAVHHDWVIKQRDVVGAFLQAEPLTDNVFITLPLAGKPFGNYWGSAYHQQLTQWCSNSRVRSMVCAHLLRRGSSRSSRRSSKWGSFSQSGILPFCT
jgi:hypothetical protein